MDHYAELPVGIALCDAVEWMGDLWRWRDLEPGLRAIELQPELIDPPAGFVDIAPDEMRHLLGECMPELKFLSVHSPSSTVDLSSPDHDYREHSVWIVRKALRWAIDVGADTFVIHAGTCEWDHAHDRAHRRHEFLRSFSELGSFWRNHTSEARKPELLVENLEYPQLASTTQELQRLAHECDRHATVRLCIDIPHLWHTRRLLRQPENGSHKSQVLPDQLDAHSFGGFFNKSMHALNHEISLLHLAGCGFHETHAPIAWPESGPPWGPEQPGEGLNEMVDLRPVMRGLDHMPESRGRVWILEIYEGGESAVRESLHRVRHFRREYCTSQRPMAQ